MKSYLDHESESDTSLRRASRNPGAGGDVPFVLAADITDPGIIEERFQLVVEASPSAMIMIGTGGLIVLVNTQAERLFGYGRQELLGNTMEMLVPERFRSQHGAHRKKFFGAPVTRVMGGGQELYGLRKDGSEVPVEIGLNPIAAGDGHFVLASITDVTERRKTEERFKLVVEASPSAMIMVGADGLITFVNTQTERLFGYGRTELLGRSMDMLLPHRFRPHHSSHRSAYFTAPTTRLMGAGRDLFGLRKDGSEVAVEIGLNPIRWIHSGLDRFVSGETTTEIGRKPGVDEEGHFVLASIIDITERKRVAAELQFKAAEMERFTYTVSHDLKSPLITIKSYLGMIDRDLAEGKVDRVRPDLQRVAKAADKMYQLLEEVLNLSRVGRVENTPEKVAFASMVEEALELVAGRISAGSIRVDVAVDLPSVTVDRRRMVEVLQNLIDNAAKFMGSQADPEIRIGALTDGALNRFFVKDNGAGVEARYHERIFGLFDKLNAKSEGSGAGLAIAKRTINVHGGRIWIESAGKGCGSTLWFTLNPDSIQEAVPAAGKEGHD